MGKKTRIAIDHSVCGDGNRIDPRSCGACLRACDPAVFLLHQSVGAKEPDPLDPQVWRITPLYPSLCTRCMKCVEVCPEKAIRVSW
jgi:NAD-dependent dihydropyrimidine dehydrogenase PreA subunit